MSPHQSPRSLVPRWTSGVPSAVLPSFEVTLEPEEKFLYIDRKENFRVSITAKCVCGGGDTPKRRGDIGWP